MASLVEEAAAQAATRRRQRATGRRPEDAGQSPIQFDLALHADAERDQWSDDSLWPGTVANPRRTRVR